MSLRKPAAKGKAETVKPHRRRKCLSKMSLDSADFAATSHRIAQHFRANFAPWVREPESRWFTRFAEENRSYWGFGESGIRTHGRVSPTHAFQACSFNHSDISPHLKSITYE